MNLWQPLTITARSSRRDRLQRAAMNRFPRRACAFTAFLLLVAVALPVAAITAIERDFPALVERAEQIVEGRVTSMETGRDGHGAPVTLVTFDDLTVFKGNVGAQLTLEFAGGPIDGGGQVVIPDMPKFHVGERAVLFVAGNGRDVCPLVGIWQGRFRVVEGDGGKRMVESHDGSRVTGLSGRKIRTAKNGASTEPPISLEDFGALIREELAHPSSAEVAK